jgi:hypothetical protein
VQVASGRSYTKKNMEKVGKVTGTSIVRRKKSLFYKMCHMSGSIGNIGVLRDVTKHAQRVHQLH